jgi:hypothetical protein
MEKERERERERRREGEKERRREGEKERRRERGGRKVARRDRGESEQDPPSHAAVAARRSLTPACATSLGATATLT